MKIMMAIMKTNVKMMTMMMDENIATCGGAGLGECPLAVQTEAGIPSTIQIQPPLPSDKDDDDNITDDDLEDDDNDHADDCNADGGGDDNNDGDEGDGDDGCYNDDDDYQTHVR